MQKISTCVEYFLTRYNVTNIWDIKNEKNIFPRWNERIIWVKNACIITAAKKTTLFDKNILTRNAIRLFLPLEPNKFFNQFVLGNSLKCNF